MSRFIPFGLLCLLGLLVSIDAHANELSPALPYSAERSHPVTYDAQLQVTITAPYKTKLLRVWMPVPPSDRGQELESSEFSTFPDTVSPQLANEPLFGNRFAYFEFPNPQGAMVISHRLKIKVWELRWHLDPQSVRSISKWPDSFAPYLRGESQAVVLDERFNRLLSEIAPERRNPLFDLQSVMSFADRNFIYDHSKASLKASSAHALENRRGHCSDYHGFCAAMGRVMSQPTRVTYGINPFPKASPSHCKLEAFIAPYGWVSFDVSETQKLTSSLRQNAKLTAVEQNQLVVAANQRLVQGFRDNTWFLQTRGTDYDLVPKASTRVPVVRTIYAEADGVALPDPDPSDKSQKTFAWMTAQRFDAEPQVTYPFTDIQSLKAEVAP